MKLFKPRHQFTCPDVIYLRNQQKKAQLTILGVYAVFFGGLALVGHRLEKDLDDELQKIVEETPSE